MSIKSEGGIDENTYKRLYPTGATPPKYYGLPNVHKPGMPLRAIISSIGTVTYATAKELPRILKPLVGRSPRHVMNNLDFIESIRGIQLQPEECMVSYDVEVLFTSVPVESAISIIKKHLEKVKRLHQRTAMTVNQISCLLEFCLNTTYFTFQRKMYEWVKGDTMGSPWSPIVANLFIEDFEQKAWPQHHSPLKSGKGLWMTLLLSSRKQTKMPSLITSTQLILISTLHMKIPKRWLHTFSGYVNSPRWRRQT